MHAECNTLFHKDTQGTLLLRYPMQAALTLAVLSVITVDTNHRNNLFNNLRNINNLLLAGFPLGGGGGGGGRGRPGGQRLMAY